MHLIDHMTLQLLAMTLCHKLDKQRMILQIVVFALVIKCSIVFAANKPNILMFVIDDLGWNDTSYQGSDIPTPTIDKFANEGIRLQQYYVQRVCSPTRSAIMAGRCTWAWPG